MTNEETLKWLESLIPHDKNNNLLIALYPFEVKDIQRTIAILQSQEEHSTEVTIERGMKNNGLFSDYGAFVYRNGERRRDKDDVALFATDEETFGTDSSNIPSGARIWASLLNKKEFSWETRCRITLNRMLL